ncbi:MAG TPA: 2-oxoacid:acceptor oxidoreductase subunit alpha [Candidatus Xenobia bacterium]|jgi:2-oxoglutarate ferredoxin oxidoreductase subunit alpha
MTMQAPSAHLHPVDHLDSVTVRLCGDSGDGIQVTGDQFTVSTAVAGNDLATLPDFPAEIRAPAGTLAGVSGFQICFSSHAVQTPGDQPDVLVAFNPAALRANVKDLKSNGILIVNTGEFGDRDLQKAGYTANPLEDDTLSAYQVFKVDITKLTRNALEGSPLSSKEVGRCKNFFALGLLFWLFSRPMESTRGWIQSKFAKRPEIVEANVKALEAGYNFGDTTEIFHSHFVVERAVIPAGRYRSISGNMALALGLIAASQLSGLRLFLGSYPITPASDILHELSRYKHFGVQTFQAEDEIAAIGAAIGAAFGGNLGVTSTSGPGLCLKSEAVGLAVVTELPLIICNIQRGGPSTGLPTKTEQADLLQSMYGRNGECPVPVLAASSPSDCFDTAIEAVRIAVTYMTPVIFLSDGYLANGAEPWKIPDIESLPRIAVRFRTEVENFHPFMRDDKLARPWVRPGTAGLEHRIGGLEKEDVTGNVSYDPQNHEKMCKLRAAKVAGIARDLPPATVMGPNQGKVLVIGWGSTYGAINTAVRDLQAKGHTVAHLHLRHLNPFPANLGELLKRYDRVLVPEMNLGQLVKMLRAEFLVDARGLNKIQGKPFRVEEVRRGVEALLEELK